MTAWRYNTSGNVLSVLHVGSSDWGSKLKAWVVEELHGRWGHGETQLLHLSQLFSLWTSEPERRFPLEPGWPNHTRKMLNIDAEYTQCYILAHWRNDGVANFWKYEPDNTMLTCWSHNHKSSSRNIKLKSEGRALWWEEVRYSEQKSLNQNFHSKTLRPKTKTKHHVKISTTHLQTSSSYHTLHASVRTSVCSIIRTDCS